jgi:TolA-binding protein
MKLYPGSVHIDEANEILAQLYITTRNYKDALSSLDKIRTKSEKANRAFQKVAFFRGIEYFNDRDYEKAIGLFNKAITTEIDQSIRSKAMYWKAEALYNQGQYEAAIKQYRIFIFNPPSINEANYNTGNYNIGYCYFKLENFSEANTWFRKFLKSEEKDLVRINDASIRTGDAFFMMKNYESAMDFYNQAVANNAKASDYCLFQNGMIQGIRGNTQGKIKTMDQLAARYTKSAYLDDALYEKGTALMGTENFTGAEEIFRRVIRESPNSEYAKKSLLKIALIQYNQKQDEKALTTYKDVVKKYPSTPEAAEALTGIRNIYVSNGNPQAYFDYVKNISAFSVSTGAQDSITYEAAEQLYLKGDHKNASANFKNYLEKFPNGYFVLNASFYKAESDYRNKDYAGALEGYNYVIDKPRNLFTEKSLLKAATILFENKKYDEALVNYNKLEEAADFRDNVIEAQAGQMRCHFRKGNFDSCITFARKLLEGEKVPNELITEAHLLLARSAMASNDLQTATSEFTIVAKTIPNSEAGAESRYQLALIQNILGNYKESQKKCFEVINQVPSYDFWIGKSFILLGDNYVALKDEFQAKHTYKSIIDNYEKSPSDPEDLRVIAQEKLNTLENRENEKTRQEIKEKEQKYEPMQDDSTGLENY